MEYISYSETGVQEKVALTFNALNQYTALKNQYLIYNTEGQLYVTAQDAANFEKTYKDEDGNERPSTLYDFLDCYGLFDQSREEYAEADAKYQQDVKVWEEDLKKYEDALDAFTNKTSEEWIQYNADKAAWEAEQRAIYETTPEYQAYKAAKEAFEATGGLYNTFIGIVDGNSHYNAAKNDDPGCFLHVLDNLLYDSIPCETTTGAHLTSLWETSTYNESQLHAVGDIMSDPTLGTYCVCDGQDVGAPEGKNLYQYARENGKPVTDLIKLASDYIEVDNGDGTYSYNIKTLQQKTIDMYYLIYNSNEMYTTRRGEGSNLWALSDLGVTVNDFLVDYVEGDMTQLDPEKPPYNPSPFPTPEPTMNIAYPSKPLPPEETLKIYDKPLAQWYTNLWYAMEGQTKSDEVYSTYDSNAEFSYFKVKDVEKNSNDKNNNYIIIDNSLASNSGWLQFALTNGIVTLSQASRRTNGDITWESIEASSTSDISEVSADELVELAEAEYKKTLEEIEVEDKKLDQQVRKLDTEHSALEKELESIKGVMEKNVERSFATFS